MTMSSLRAMNERMAQWMDEKPSFDGGNELRLRRDDLVLFQFASSGEDGDQLIKIYRSHILEAISKDGKKYNTTRFCPVQSGEDAACAICDALDAAGQKKDIKERMSIWMWVSNIMHMTLQGDKVFPQVQYEGRIYYNEEVNAWRIWHTSAWRESPWNDIIKLNEIYKGLHNFTAQLVVVGDGLGRRYKIYAVPNSPMLTAEQYAAAKSECESIPEILKRQMNNPVQVNPQVAQQQAAPSNAVVTPFTVGQPAAFSLGGQQPTPGSAPFDTTPSAPQIVDPPPSAPEPDQRRPLKAMF